jgi:phage terminase large subunit-like protein
MRWQMGNLKWNTQHGTNFIKPDKLRDRDKIDGCTALVQALGRSMAEENLVKVKKPFFVVTSK